MSSLELPDPPLPGDRLPPLDPQPWEPVDPRHARVLRQRLLLAFTPALVSPPALALLPGVPFNLWGPALAGSAALVLAALVFFWVPRRVRRMRYLLREKDINLRKGCWWFQSVSVALNRIQHVEVTQGPLERLQGLSALAIYTAGGHQSDVKIPGLPTDLAWRLKAHLTERAARESDAMSGEETPDEPAD